MFTAKAALASQAITRAWCTPGVCREEVSVGVGDPYQPSDRECAMRMHQRSLGAAC